MTILLELVIEGSEGRPGTVDPDGGTPPTVSVVGHTGTQAGWAETGSTSGTK